LTVLVIQVSTFPTAIIATALINMIGFHRVVRADCAKQ
jgi:hypothetical protein